MKIDCPHCGVHGSVDDSLSGKKLRCPKCSKIFLVTDDMLPDSDDTVLVHQEILHDAVSAVPPVAIVEEEVEEEQDTTEEIVAENEPEISEEASDESDEEMSDPMPAQKDEDEDLEFDNSSEEDESEMSVCSACGESFAAPFLVEIDSKLYCALCEPDSGDEEDDEDSLAFDDESDTEKSEVEDDDFLAFSGDDDDPAEDLEPALMPDEDLEVCSGCGESLHPQFLDSFEGKQYCALCFPEDDEENLELSDDTESEEEEAIELETSDSVSALMSDDVDADEANDDQQDEVEEESTTGVEGEDLDEEGFPQAACSVCGDKFHTDFLQKIDSKFYCGECQPEVIETIDANVLSVSGDEENETDDNLVATEDTEGAQERGADFTVGDTLKEAWQKTKGAKGAIWGAVFAMYLIIFGISLAGFYGTQSMMESDPTTAMGVNGGVQLVTSWLSMLMTGGLMLIGVRRALEQRVSWKMVFAAFSGKKILSMSIATVLQLLLICLGFLLLILPGIYLTVGYALALPLILDKGLGPWEALGTSRKAIHKKWWTVLGMYLVMMLLYMVSMIPLGLGLIWTVPMFMVLIGVLYGRLFGYSALEEIEEEAEVESEDESENVSEELKEESEESL